MKEELREERENLWRLAWPPVIWAAHLLASYVTAAIVCEKLAAYGAVRTAILVYTALSLGAIAFVGFRSYQRHRYGDSTTPHDFDTPADRHRFLGFATLLLAGLAGVAVVYQALPAVLIGSCR